LKQQKYFNEIFKIENWRGTLQMLANYSSDHFFLRFSAEILQTFCEHVTTWSFKKYNNFAYSPRGSLLFV